MKLDFIIPRENVIRITSTEKQAALRELVGGLETLGLIENTNRYYAQIMHRESLENTGIGNGVAIPHARTDSVKNFQSIIGVCDTPIDYQSFDSRPVKYIILSLFPTAMSTKYLYLIGMIARIFNNKENAAFLDSTPDPDMLFEYLNKESDIYFTSISAEMLKNDKDVHDLTGVPSSDLDILIRLDRLYNLYDEMNKPEALKVKIEELKKLIEYRSLAYYEKMRSKKSNPFSIVEKNTCTGCNMGIPPINIQELQARDKIQICTYCGRFLILI